MKKLLISFLILVVIGCKYETTIPLPQQNASQHLIHTHIKVAIPDYETYPQIVRQIKEWHREAKEITSIGIYGQTSQGTDLYYIKITNKFNHKKKKVILIHAAIHGIESESASLLVAYTGSILKGYGNDKEITKLVDNDEIYVVPVVSPDSYSRSREVDGRDPNRNFDESPSVPPVEAIKNLFLKIHPQVVMSMHTFMRAYLYPRGNSFDKCSNDPDYQRILGHMSELSGYKVMQAVYVYNTPISGSELDWYYKHHALSIVAEIGTHQSIPSMNDIQVELHKTWQAFLYYLEEAPKVKVLMHT